MRTSTAYFAGLGTVVVAVAAGLGGGYLAANIVNPHEPGVSKLERRMSATPIPAPAAPSEPVRIAGTTATATNPIAASPVAAPPQTEPQQTAASQASAPQASALQTPPKSEPQTTASNVVAPAEEKTANNAPRTVQPVPAKPAEQASEKPMVEKTAAPQEAFARARDADIKRAAVEKRRAERRQRWEERRRFRQPREQELEAVEEKVREVTEPRHAFAVERVRTESPRIRLFDLD
jgi:hypothetical protein